MSKDKALYRVSRELAETMADKALELAGMKNTTWQWLVEPNHPWMKQMTIKGKKLRASTVYYDMIANSLSVAEAAANFSIPEFAVNEVILWCGLNTELLKAEAAKEAIVMEEALNHDF